MSLALLNSYDTNRNDDINSSVAFSTIDEGANFALLRRFLAAPVRPSVERPVRDLKNQFVSVAFAAPDVEVLTRKAQSAVAEESLLLNDNTSPDDGTILLLIDPDEVGSFEPDNGFEMRVHLLPAQEGRFAPIEWDEVDEELFDVY